MVNLLVGNVLLILKNADQIRDNVPYKTENGDELTRHIQPPWDGSRADCAAATPAASGDTTIETAAARRVALDLNAMITGSFRGTISEAAVCLLA